MKFIEPKNRNRPFSTSKTHARLRHDYALWHPEHASTALASNEKREHEHAIPFSNRSKFDSAHTIADAISQSYSHPAVEADNRNHVVVFDMGYIVGFDERARRTTSAVTVVLKPSGEVITVHPGTPWSNDQRGNL